MRALTPVQSGEPSDTVDMPVQSTPVPTEEIPSNTPAEAEIPVSPIAPETIPSPVHNTTVNMTPPPGNWTVTQDDIYS